MHGSSPPRVPPPSAASEAAQPVYDERMELLKRAYRTIKKEMKDREEEFDAERATNQRERRLLMQRVEELERELAEMKESVRSRGRRAGERLENIERNGQVAAPATVAAPTAAPAADKALSSYQRGMELAGKVMNARDTLSAALSTSGFKEVVKESVSAIAMPQSVQQQLQRQQDLFEAQAQVQQSLWLDLREAESALARSDSSLQAEAALREQDRRLCGQALQELAETRAALTSSHLQQQQLQAVLASAQVEMTRSVAQERAAQQQQLGELSQMLCGLLHDACVASEMTRLTLQVTPHHPHPIPSTPPCPTLPYPTSPRPTTLRPVPLYPNAAQLYPSPSFTTPPNLAPPHPTSYSFPYHPVPPHPIQSHLICPIQSRLIDPTSLSCLLYTHAYQKAECNNTIACV